MSETSRMDPTQLSILFSVIVYHNVNAHNIITCGIRTLSEFASRRVTEGMVWSLEGVDTRVHCVVLCMQDPQCITAGYSPDGGQCRGYNVSYTSPANVTYVTDPGANMFLTCGGETTDLGLVDNTCTTSSDCLGALSVCRSGHCQCEIGYSQSRHTGSDTCETHCTEYGTTFTLSTDRVVFDMNNKTENGLTQTQCLEMCLNENDFLCKSLEYQPSNGKCSTMSFTWLDISQADEPTLGWNVFTRNCNI